ncbi:MAG: choice-of-anchor P family protein [Candidatus Binatia bacterium]
MTTSARSRRRRAILGAAVTIFALAAGRLPLSTEAANPTTVSGEAFGVSLTSLNMNITKLPDVVLDPQGGLASASAAGVNAPGLATSGTIAVVTQGTTGATAADAQSTSTVEQVNLLNGLITADVVTAQSTSTCDGATASSSDQGTTLVNLVVNGNSIGSTPAPNTVIAIPNGTVTLNEQTTGGNGMNTSSLTVNVIHVRVTLPLIGDVDIIVASAHSDVTCLSPAGPTPTPTAPVCIPGSTATPNPQPTTPIVSGEAYGAFVDVVGTTLPKNPHVVLAPTGGSLTATVMGLNIPNVLSASTLTAETNGSTTATTANADSTATVEQLNAVNGLVTADLVQAMASSSCNGQTATSSDAGTQFVNLVVNGNPIVGTPPPNTMINVVGVGTVILNEQIPGGDGINTSSLTVNLVHIILTNSLDGEIVISSAHSDVNCAPATTPTPTPSGAVPTCTIAPTATPMGTAVTPTRTATPGTPGRTATPGTPGPTATPDPGLDHFLCYEIHRAPVRLEGLSLVDRFGASTVSIRQAKRICLPADKNDEDPTAPSDPEHLTAYTINQNNPHFFKMRGLVVIDQFGAMSIDLIKADRLLVPTRKSLTMTPPLPGSAVDHFKCYKIGSAKRRVLSLKIDDQFGTITVDIKRPVHFCVPVDKNNEGIPNPSQYLTCYQVRIPTGTPPANTPDEVFANNQFGPDTYAVLGPRELCVPSAPSP